MHFLHQYTFKHPKLVPFQNCWYVIHPLGLWVIYQLECPFWLGFHLFSPSDMWHVHSSPPLHNILFQFVLGIASHNCNANPLLPLFLLLSLLPLCFHHCHCHCLCFRHHRHAAAPVSDVIITTNCAATATAAAALACRPGVTSQGQWPLMPWSSPWLGCERSILDDILLSRF